jgi:hypothetical protein
MASGMQRISGCLDAIIYRPQENSSAGLLRALRQFTLFSIDIFLQKVPLAGCKAPFDATLLLAWNSLGIGHQIAQRLERSGSSE